VPNFEYELGPPPPLALAAASAGLEATETYGPPTLPPQTPNQRRPDGDPHHAHNRA
jgi:hypothetical protein